ncbi:hypothetical protein [Tropicibacter naphthalenivorans]|uniref:DUF883 domain-containing protein n=1 Tax=Tropicibacter naphthalenivorans TaxID=441103 RepID=A0A0P1G1P3_9RHOB|nr:hypothetical protein [Tropicibacter naphthalenivorans]CUH75623.1 hypothetical protein TRN7648_00532 [Tropicibacter naphthalenivorans]SMC43165.1 hypothetical protein SAMN04488093_101347 [Tropicibacter naphthalenivorans]
MTYHDMEQTPRSNGHDTSGVADKARKAAEGFTARATETAENAKAKAYDAAGKGQEQLTLARSEFERGVQKNPGLAVLGAVGVGVLLGLALRGRR